MASSKNSSAEVNKNQLLAGLSTACYQRLLPLLEPVTFAIGEILYEPQLKIQYVYFPHQSIISMVNLMHNKVRVEMAIIGSEGMLGTALLSGDDLSPHQAIVQIADSGERMSAQAFTREIDQNAEFQKQVLLYSHTLFLQVAQTAACNTFHPIVQRLARWLLMTQDRMGLETLHLTHEFIATMLGVQRAGVTIAAGTLQKAGIIEYRRGNVTILKRQQLESSACECYESVKAETSRLVDNYKKK